MMKNKAFRYRNLLKDDLQRTTDLMLRAVENAPKTIGSEIRQLITSGGKRLRPALVLLSAKVYDAPMDGARYTAAAVELLHTATLIHDDLIDNSAIRRSNATINSKFTTGATVLAGDYTFAIAAKLGADSKNVEIVLRFSETLETICRGELNQMFDGVGSIPTEQDYFDRIYAKTASLFELCTESGAILAGLPQQHREQAKTIGRALGEAFQIVDDILDFMGDVKDLGKPTGADLNQGLITLPVLHYIRTHPDDNRFAQIIEQTAPPALIHAVVDDLSKSDAADWALDQARQRIQPANDVLQALPDSIYRDALLELAAFAVKRRH